MEYDSNAMETKWRARWFGERIFEAKRVEGKGKFFIVFAYPGVSGYLHVGHMRGFTYADIIARYQRMLGNQVLYPAGFHASGLPAIGLAKRVARKDPKTLEYLRRSGTPEEVIPTLGDPRKVVDYFSTIYTEDYWKRFGFTIDYTRAMTTISPGYNNFIKWQFVKLNQQGLLTHKPHYAPFCPECGPIAVDASQTDVSSGGDAQVLEFTALKFKDDSGLIYPAATLRPETVFGVTNMWLNQNVEYVIAKVGGEKWVVTPQALAKLRFQKEGVEEAGKVSGRSLIGKTLIVPLTGARVPILPGPFVDPDVATGVVMSVPAHAPYDWAALVDAQKAAAELEKEYGIPASSVTSIKAISLINTSKRVSENPAGDICKNMGITSQDQKQLLDEATGVIYKDEFHSGLLKDNCGKYSGLRVNQIKDTLRADFLRDGLADVFFEFSQPVVCRCDSRVVIKRIPKQWFIRYSDLGLTERCKEHAMTMKIIPKEYYNELPGVLDWFSDRACIRQGSWLGTEFPFEKGWIIEPISDSTLYPAYYTVSKYVNDGSLTPSDLTEAFFDYVFLGEGAIGSFPEGKRDIIETVKKDFDYWYPLDINLGGKEHKTVHFPVFVMNHCAILPGWKWPRGIFVNWWVTMSGGEKIAKSKGGAEPIPDAIQKYGVDAMRLYYTHVGSSYLDIEWDERTVSGYRSRTKKVWNLATDILQAPEGRADGILDEWLEARMAQRASDAAGFLKDYDLRAASDVVFFGIPQDLQWYSQRHGSNKAVLMSACKTWIALMSPFTPFLAEELWEHFGQAGFVSLAPFPQLKGPSDRTPLYRESLLESTLSDVKDILEIVKKKPKAIHIFTTPAWRKAVTDRLLQMKTSDMSAKKLDVGAVIKEMMALPEMKPFAKEIPKFVTPQAQAVAIMSEDEVARYKAGFDEREFLSTARGFLESELGCPVTIESADSPGISDPQGKAKQAKPRRPAIYVETEA